MARVSGAGPRNGRHDAADGEVRTVSSQLMKSAGAGVVGALALFLTSGTALAADPVFQDLGGGWRVVIFDPVNVKITVSNPATIFADGKLSLVKEATVADLDFGQIAPIQLAFQQIAPDATTVPIIEFTEKVILNQTGIAATAARETIGISGRVRFDVPASATYSIDPFTTRAYNASNTDVLFSGGVVPNGGTWNPGATSGGLTYAIDLSSAPVTFFTKTFLIPTPGSAVLLGAAGGLMALRRRR